MEALRIVQKMVWGPWLLGLFLAVGVLCMVRLRGFPIRHIRVWWRETVGSGGKGQLLTTCTALAATVGTGNITGVAAALAIGGPGAVFWMWAAAFLGMALAYTEVYLGILYGGGPYVYLENGAGSCFAGKCYALFCVLASLGMGCMVQAGALADSLRYAASLPPLGTGIILAVLTAVVLFGGAKRIGWTASVLVPVSAGLYLLAGGIAVFSFYDQIPEVLGKIVGGAFGLADNAGQTDGSSILNFSGISGGMTGYGMAAAIRSGVSRGVFRYDHRVQPDRFFTALCISTQSDREDRFPGRQRRGGGGSGSPFWKCRRHSDGGVYGAVCLCHDPCLVLHRRSGTWMADAGCPTEACRQNMYFVSRRLSCLGLSRLRQPDGSRLGGI